MPRRWLSVRTRKEEQKTRQEVAEAHLQEDFDFAFAAEEHIQRGRCELSSPEDLRPTTSDGGRYKSRRKPDLTLLIERPKSSDPVVPNKPLSAARLDDSQIGIAFGSPRHPPQVLESIDSTMSPDQQHHAFFLQGRLPAQPAKGKKWKFGGFFRPRAYANREPPFYRVQQVDVPEAKKLGMPIVRTPWRNPKSPMTEQDHFEEQTPLRVGDGSKVVLPSISAAEYRTQHKDIRALQVTVPQTPSERCNVASKGVNAAKQSGLLARRSRDLNPLLIATDTEQKNTELTVPKLARRATSPTTSKYPDTIHTCNNGLASSKYSLFPATPTSIRLLSQADSPVSARTRSATGPPQFSSAQVTPLKAPEAHRSASEQRLASLSNQCESPIDSRISNSTMADNARVSSQNEIFFDVQSFRDSRGQVGQQFEMTRPPSAAVQLARSKSNARRLLQEKLDAKVRDQQHETDENQIEKTTSTEIDDTIAIVESLTSPSRTDRALPQLPQTTYNPGLERDSNYAMDVEGTNAVSSARKTELKARLDTLNIDVPSPVLEQLEETTPRTLSSANPTDSADQQPAHNAPTAAVLPVKSTFSPPVTARNSPSPRPNLPIKDSKYIPLSKYAPRRTTEDLVRQTGLRPVRVTRSNTEDTTAWAVRSSSLQRPCIERSSTIPPLIPKPLSNRSNLPPRVPAGTGTKNSPNMIAYVNPAAEVSVARTVSLTRKPSARVIGPKLPTRAASRKEHAQEEVKERKVVLGTPVVQEVHKGHKPGLSQEVVLDTATIAPSSPPPPLPSPHVFMKVSREVPPLPPLVDAA